MRISTGYISQTFIDNMNNQETALANTQQQISTGLKFSQPAQDPAAASQSLDMLATIDQTTQYGTNSNLAQSRLSIEDSTLTTLTNTLQRVRNLAVQGVNATQTADTRSSIAIELKQTLNSIVQIANTQDGSGQYIFAGSATSTTPFAQSATGYAYAGDQTQRLVQIGPNRQVADGDPGSAVFQQVRNGNGTFVVGANTANTGSAVIGANTLVNAQQWAAGAPPYTLTFTSPTAYTVTDSSAPPVSVAAGNYTDGQSISFNGAQLQVSGTPAANDTYTITPSTNQDIFTTVQNLINAFSSGTPGTAGQAQLQNSVNRVVESLDQSLTNVSNVQSAVGARLNAIDGQNSSNADLTLQVKSTLSNLRDLDYASAITRLNQQMTGLQAAQASFVKIQNLSLFNYIQ